MRSSGRPSSRPPLPISSSKDDAKKLNLGLRLRRASIPLPGNASLVEVHKNFVFLVLPTAPDTVEVLPLPGDLRSISSSSSSSAPPAGVDSRRLLQAPQHATLKSICCHGGEDVEGTQQDFLVLGASTHEVFVWNFRPPSSGRPASSSSARAVGGRSRPPRPPLPGEGGAPYPAASIAAAPGCDPVLAPSVVVTGFVAPPPTLPLLALDSSGAVGAVGSLDQQGQPALLLFSVADGAKVGNCLVPSPIEIRPELGVSDFEDRGEALGGLSPITACGFLAGEFSFVAVTALEDGSVCLFDLRGCGESSKRQGCAYQTAALTGTPFSSLALVKGDSSTFFIGGCSTVHIMQVWDRNGSLRCAHLAQVPLGEAGKPAWLRDEVNPDNFANRCEKAYSSNNNNNNSNNNSNTNNNINGDSCWLSNGITSNEGNVIKSSSFGSSGGLPTGEAVLSLVALCCRCSEGPSTLDLRGSFGVALCTNGLYAIYGHSRHAERVGDVPPSTVHSGLSIQADGNIVGVTLGAFSQELEAISITLPDNLNPSLDDTEAEVRPSSGGLGSLLADLQNEAEFDDIPICSVMPFGAIPPTSILGRALAPTPPQSAGAAPATSTRPRNSPQHRSGSAPSRPRLGGSISGPSSQPVTFHRKVKSAGYGPSQTPPRQLFRPQLVSAQSGSKSRPDFGVDRSIGRRSSRQGSSNSGYLAGSLGPPLEKACEAVVAYPQCAVTDVRFTPQATHLIAAGSDKTMTVWRLPLKSASASARPIGFLGHQGDITSLCPSLTDSYSSGGGGSSLLLTSSTDSTARLWSLGGQRAGQELLCFDRLKTSQKAVSREDNPKLEQVQDAQFMCLDGAIVLATGSRLGVYRYELHVQDDNDDIKRLQSLGSYKCCGLLTLPKEGSAGHCIAAVAVNNSLLSSTAVVASSGKQIYAWDVSASKVLSKVPDGSLHTRPVSCLRLASPHSDFQTPQSLDLFYTASQDGRIRLWDLRTMDCCRTFEGGHVHSGHRLRCCLSPCLRYLCTPSEDGHLCIYDVRSERVLGVKHGHRDVAASVDLNPRTGSMASGGYDGKLQFHKPPSEGKRSIPGKPPGGQVERHRAVKEVEMEVDF